jgi:hypothetical protein
MDREPLFVEEITRAIDYQLVERLKFVKGKDPSVASLLFDYAITPHWRQPLILWNRKGPALNGSRIRLSLRPDHALALQLHMEDPFGPCA